MVLFDVARCTGQCQYHYCSFYVCYERKKPQSCHNLVSYSLQPLELNLAIDQWLGKILHIKRPNLSHKRKFNIRQGHIRQWTGYYYSLWVSFTDIKFNGINNAAWASRLYHKTSDVSSRTDRAFCSEGKILQHSSPFKFLLFVINNNTAQVSHIMIWFLTFHHEVQTVDWPCISSRGECTPSLPSIATSPTCKQKQRAPNKPKCWLNTRLTLQIFGEHSNFTFISSLKSNLRLSYYSRIFKGGW